MKNNNINWWLLIGVAVVVAVIASLITAGITGNVIRVKDDKLKRLINTPNQMSKPDPSWNETPNKALTDKIGNNP